MEAAWTRYYSISKIMLSFIGQWPYQGKRTRVFRMSLLTVITFSILVPQVAQIVHCDGNKQCIMLTIPLMMVTLIILVKLYTCQFNNSKIKILINYVRDDWEMLKNAEEYEIMKTYGVRARLLSLMYSLYLSIAVALFLLTSLVPQILNVVLPLNESRPIIMPYEGYYFVDIEEYFFYIFFHSAVSVHICLCAIFAHDCTLLVYIQHVCGLFALTGFRLQMVSRNGHNDAPNDNLKNSWKTYDRKIAISVHAHWRALRFAKLLEDTFCVTLAIQMIIVVFMLSITLLQIALEFDEVIITIRRTSYMISQLLHLFCYSLQGQILINHSVQIREKIYNSSWYEIPVRSQKLLLSVMRRSLEPNFLSAGKIYIFSLKSFTSVLQSSMSYFTMLASFQ